MQLEQTELSSLLEVAIVAARSAGQRAIEEQAYITTSIKNGSDLVTQADTICQKLIIDCVKETYPDHGFIAEEGADGKLLVIPPRGSNPIWWVIDPIDGTNNYAHRVQCFSVSVAAFYEGRPVVGVIFDPSTETLFSAVEGESARRNGSEIAAQDAPLDRFTNFGVDNNFEGATRIPPQVEKLMLMTRFRDLGSTALHLAYVASGGFLGMVNATPKLWDIAAGALIAETAGARVTDLKGQPLWPVDLAAYDGGKCPILAAGKTAHPAILDILKGYPV